MFFFTTFSNTSPIDVLGLNAILIIFTRQEVSQSYIFILITGYADKTASEVAEDELR